MEIFICLERRLKKIKKILDAFEESQKENKTKKKTKIKEFILTQLFDIRKKRKQELCEEKTECKDGECSKEYAQLAMKPLDRNSLDYKIIRLFHDQGGVNAENAIMKDLDKETDKNKRGKMMYYFAMYFDLKGMNQIAREYFVKIQKMQSPMFFEYRLAEWGMEQ